MVRLNHLIGAAACVFALAACNGSSNGGAGASGSIGASPSLGAFRNATVFFFRADGSTEIGNAEVDENGQAQISTGSYSGPVVIEVRGDDDAEYFDEATGMFEDFPAGNSIFSMAPSTGGTVAVTPLTDAAYRAAVRNSLLPLSAQEVNDLNQIVADALAGGIDILTQPAAVNVAMSMDLPATDAGRYALVLATLAYLGTDGSNDAASTTPPALAVLLALLDDLADGVIDNMNDGSTISAAYSDFVNEFSAAILNAASAYASSDLNDEVSNGDQDYENPNADLSDLDAVEDSGGDTGGGGGTGGGDTTVDSSGLQDLGNGNGVTGTLSGTRRTTNLSTNASEGVGGTISVFGFGQPPSGGQWNLNLIQNQAGVQTCEGDGVMLQFSDGSGNAFFADGDTGDEGGVCQLELTQVAVEGGDTTIEGVFTGTLIAGESNSDTASKTLTRGAFRAQVNFQ